MTQLTYVLDTETYPNCFLLIAIVADSEITFTFEISDYKDERKELMSFFNMLQKQNARACGFNIVGFDYPVIHTFIKSGGKATAKQLYVNAMEIIKGSDEDRFANVIYPDNWYFDLLDLYKIHHYDNRAKSTSLKALEFAMRMDNISDLPFLVGTMLNPEQIVVLKDYCRHDVRATEVFRLKSLKQIKFREELTKKHGKSFMNHNDTKIGAEIFQMELEKAGVQCYEYGPFGRQMRQTKRASIALNECVPKWVRFHNPEFTRIKEWFEQQVIVETKGAFEISAHVAGLDFIYGTGGLHASVENQTFVSNDEWVLVDADVTSLYPSIAIEHGHYPQHLGSLFVEIYRKLRTQRVSYKKGTAENAMLKLALNGVYGKSSDKYSIFFDPLFTMKITVGGQMMISMFADRVVHFLRDSVKIVQVNTDGITFYLRRDARVTFDAICKQWEADTKLTLEYVDYTKMVIRDVNNYEAQKLNGEVKRKGAYEYEKEWHQDASFLVIPKVAEQVLIHGKPIRETLEQWPDKYDFFGRVKIPRGSKLVIHEDGVDRDLENTQRYYVSQGGGQLFKIMPPLAKKPGVWRRIGVESGWSVCPCNDIREATAPIDYTYYQNEIEKICLSVM